TLSKIRFKQTQIRLWFGISSKQDPSSSMKTNRDMKFLMYSVALELDSHQIMLLLLWIVWWQGRILLQEGTLMLLREQHIGK
ncbi:hypothetical protein S83_055711, partial [Arachis hypogaea]